MNKYNSKRLPSGTWEILTADPILPKVHQFKFDEESSEISVNEFLFEKYKDGEIELMEIFRMISNWSTKSGGISPLEIIKNDKTKDVIFAVTTSAHLTYSTTHFYLSSIE